MDSRDSTPAGVQRTALPVEGHHSCGGTRDCTVKGQHSCGDSRDCTGCQGGSALVGKQGTALDVVGQHSCGDSRDCTGCQMTVLSCANSRDCIGSQERALLWKFKGLHWLSEAGTPAEIQGTALTVMGQHSCGSSRASIHVFLWGDQRTGEGQHWYMSQGGQKYPESLKIRPLGLHN